MTARPSSLERTESTTSINAPVAQNAALRGAALAFSKPAVTPKPSNYSGNNGALAAATKADGNMQSASRSLPINQTSSNGKDGRLVPQHSGASSIYTGTGGGLELPSVRHRLNQLSKYGSSEHLQLPSAAADRTTSPSHIAATLAASRSGPNTPNHTGQHSLGFPRATSSSRRSSIRSNSRSRDLPEDALDTTSIPPTNALIGMFERTGGVTLSASEAMTTTKYSAPELKSPKPLRSQSVTLKGAITKSPKPTMPASRRDVSEEAPRRQSVRRESSKKHDNEDASSDDSFVSASDRRPQSSLARSRRSTSASAESRTIDSMANAIVASSLASSRAASPSKTSLNAGPPVPPPRRGNTRLQAPNTLDMRTPSPAKGLRQTMRKPPKDEEEEDPNMIRRGRKNLMKKHPNKHHEGDRKRWRDSITERERKRYEAVWASNKGLYVINAGASFPPPPTSNATANILNSNNLTDTVSNIVVRDVWSRSRLGADELAEVWDLVDRSGTGRLCREEFVVGLWLIDQRLKGRKLPVRVGASVWSSIATLGGVKVRGNGRKR